MAASFPPRTCLFLASCPLGPEPSPLFLFDASHLGFPREPLDTGPMPLVRRPRALLRDALLLDPVRLELLEGLE
jgi:hypothetical protein